MTGFRTPATINGETYPIAQEKDRTLWETVDAGEELIEYFDDWSSGLGETEKITGRGHYFSAGLDPSHQGVLRLHPHWEFLAGSSFTTGYGYFMEDVGAGASATLDTVYSSGSAGPSAASITVAHTVTANNNVILLVGVASEKGSGLGRPPSAVTYNGLSMTPAGTRAMSSPSSLAVAIFYLVNPPTGTAYNIVATFPGTQSGIVLGAANIYNVDLNDPIREFASAEGSSTTPSVTVTTGATDLILGTVSAASAVTATAGTNETERWDATGASTMMGWGATQAGSDGGAIAPTLSSTSAWLIAAVSIKAAPDTKAMFIADGTNIFKYTYNPSASPTLALVATTAVASGSPGRPAKFKGKWYAAEGASANVRRLDDVATPTWADAGFEAGHQATYQRLGTPFIARSETADANEVGIASSAPTSDSSFDVGTEVGDTTTGITDMIEAQGLLFVAKSDGLFDFGTESDSRRVLPSFNRGNADTDNGKGMAAFGDRIIYPSNQGAWRYIIGRSARPVGQEDIPYFFDRSGVMGVTVPKSGRYVWFVTIGKYWYGLFNSYNLTYVQQFRERTDFDPPGPEMVINNVAVLPLCKGAYVDSDNYLWLKGAAAAAPQRGVFVIHLDAFGGTDVQGRRGNTEFPAPAFYMDERNYDRPDEIKQLRAFGVELENWDANISLQLNAFRDNGVSEDVGAAITADGVTVRNWTVGTSDTCYRYRPALSLTVDSAYSPAGGDPRILRCWVKARTPEILRIVIPADDDALKPFQKTALEAEQNLKRLLSQGPVTFRRPGDYDDPAASGDAVADRTFDGEVIGVTDTLYMVEDGRYGKGIVLTVRRWATF